ncbi:MAG: hypothetical protein GDA53_08565 [Rhodobacteraceae bacterium]|nr:hypothetical protein [Paracoccaceae bacterium]
MAVTMTGVTLVLLALGGLSLALRHGPIEMPQARAFVESALNERLEDQTLTIGAVALKSANNGTGNQLHLREVKIKSGDGSPVLTLAEIYMDYALSDLLSGQLSPSEIILVGTELTLRRHADGRIEFLSPGETSGEDSLVGAIETLTARPGFASLQRVDLSGARVLMDDVATGRTWILEKNTLKLTRSGAHAFALNAVLALSEGDDPAGADKTLLRFKAEAASGDEDVDLSFQFEDAWPVHIAELFPAFDWLRNIDTKISGYIRARLARDGHVSGFSGVLSLGQGRITGTPDKAPLTLSRAKIYFTYERSEDVLTLQQVEAETSSGILSGDGFVKLTRNTGGGVSSLAGQLRFNKIVINRPDIFAQMVYLDGASADVRVSFNPLVVEIGQLSVFYDEMTIRAAGKSMAGKEYWSNRYDIDINQIQDEHLLGLWPLTLAPKTRRWLVENIRDGVATDFRGGFRSDGGALTYAMNFDIEGVKSGFLGTLPDLQEGRGFGYLTEKEFRLDISDGYVLADDGTKVLVAGSSLYIPDITTRPLPGEITLRASGGLQAALHLLNAEKFRLPDKMNVSPQMVSGRAEVAGIFRLPLNRNTTFGQVELDVSATLTDVTADTLIEKRKLHGSEIHVHVTDTAIRLTGNFTLDGVPITATWTQPFGNAAAKGSSINAQFTLNEHNLKAFGVVLPPGVLGGSALGNMTITLKPGRTPHYTLTSDLRGAGLRVPAIGWSKPANSEGILSLSGSLGDHPGVDNFSLSGGGLSAGGRLHLTPSGTLARVDLDDLKIGSWLDTRAVITTHDPDSANIQLNGGVMDLRRFNPGGGVDTGNIMIGARLDRLIVTNEIALTNLTANLTTGSGLRGSFKAQVNGEAPISGRIFPRTHGTAIELLSDNAGGVLRSAGLLKNAKWGNMRAIIVPGSGKGNYDGTITVENIRLRESSAMANLLNAVSLVGLLQQLNGSGIHFSAVDGQFFLRDGEVRLKNISAVGPSMGLTLNGRYHRDSKMVDFEGVMTPLYAMNGMFERIFGALVGRHKGEGIFSLTYRMQGPSANPGVSVNPLSILAPGAFRELFRTTAPARVTSGQDNTEDRTP